MKKKVADEKPPVGKYLYKGQPVNTMKRKDLEAQLLAAVDCALLFQKQMNDLQIEARIKDQIIDKLTDKMKGSY